MKKKEMQYALLLGDSLTQQGYESGWASRLSKRYVRRADVINRGLSGYNTRWVLDILKDDTRRQQLLPTQPGKALFVTLMLGSNDCAGFPQQVSLDEYGANLRAIIDTVRKHVCPVGGIFLLSPSPLDEKGRLQWLRDVGCDPNSCGRSFESMRRYRDASLRVGAEEYEEHGDVFTVDLYRVFLGRSADTVPYAEGSWCEYFSDGLHFNENGGRVVFEALWCAIEKSVKASHILPDRLPYVLPPHETLVGGSS
ncbi:putative esterase [Trypanosoma cruzi]|uniref:Esterase, putative n=2 Tax=Trypanosoma cruzi TaxID=5693 RepID=Q4D492_TRYCC|nr:esterase, putative [Trypanosoma cruzi]XP_817785.1 esterase, putative [Trypanosoma cruzi]EAN87337.1 esterase, putative [Trypanosoma cruzi]EAN95934.1 esterase, putative [Trypanosoma cruzi]PWV05218.1 putative esterase [Trypanosoma cruzi]|eukprot:XP_809188.1 esterase [Trypanosoma cruzi strain CL Brener]